MKTSLILFVCLAALGCKGSSNKLPSPADPINAYYHALETQDSASFMESMSSEKREGYLLNPQSIRDLMNDWKGRHAAIQVLAIKQSGDTLATVLYNLRITGTNPQTQDSVRTRVLVENGEWKRGY